MSKSSEVVELLLEQPDAFKVIEAAQNKLREEQARRERFYDEITPDIKAEFINGEMIVHSPVRSRHAFVSDCAFRIVSLYTLRHQLGRSTHEKVMSRFTRNDYEPDIMFFRKEKADAIQPNQALFPVPDFVIEVLSSATEGRDRGVKYNDYASHGVEEYWMIDADADIIEQYHLENGEYKLIKKTDEGVVHSFVIEGLNIPVRAMFDHEIHVKFVQEILA
ncbi:MAG: Uma2 family endonuclease [Spirosomaceae bacterium]|jgi:Uma2 family endonuclease|nr:Uma2 family endonuclease [Spirosomataceae bacterium]